MTSSNPLPNVRALVFDLIGTTTDWHTPVATALKAHATAYPKLASRDWNAFAHEWRGDFFKFVAGLAKQGKEKPINEVYQSTLDALMSRERITEWDEAEQKDLIKSWAMMEAWRDTVPGLTALRNKFAIAVLSNGSSRTVIDSNKRNNMIFDVILTSNIVGHYKPNPQMYEAAQGALQYEPSEIAMVAAHAYDLDAAATHGFRTIYIMRHTEDIDLDPSTFQKYDLVINEGGLSELARRLGALEE